MVYWIKGKDFLEIISPYIHYSVSDRTDHFKINNVVMEQYDKDSDIVHKLLRKERTRIKESTAERILTRINFDPYLIDDIKYIIKNKEWIKCR